MIRRILLALLTLCLALPAAAMPLAHQPAPAPHANHGPVAMHRPGDAGVGHHAMPAPADHSAAGASHDCIGCIAPYAGEPAVPAAGPQPSLMHRAGRFHGLPARDGSPDPPPPRS